MKNEEEIRSYGLNWKKISLVVFVLLLLVNLGFLNFFVFFKPEDDSPAKSEPLFQSPIQENFQISSLGAEKDQEPQTLGQADGCPQACLDAIAKITSGQVVSIEGMKVAYVPLGRGSTTSTNYEEINGAEAVIDLARYPAIETVYFEANLKILKGGGRVYAKLYNVTDQHDAWNSEVYLDGSGPYRAEAKDVVLAPGRKLYRVKMMSTMGTEGVLDSGRLKILLK